MSQNGLLKCPPPLLLPLEGPEICKKQLTRILPIFLINAETNKKKLALSYS